MAEAKTKEQVLAELSDNDRAQLHGALKTWRKEGVENPLIPLGDVDGDGIIEAWALDLEGELTLVATGLDETVFESTGEGIELGGIPQEGAE